MREAVDTLPESSSRLCVSLFIVSTLMSGLPSVTPRRPGGGKKTTKSFLYSNAKSVRNSAAARGAGLTAFALAVEDENQNQEKNEEQDGGAHCSNGYNPHWNLLCGRDTRLKQTICKVKPFHFFILKQFMADLLGNNYCLSHMHLCGGWPVDGHRLAS